jgi:3-methyladenine DNA glycosylase AlkC
MEQIAMDMGILLAAQFPAAAARADEVRDVGLVARMRAGGRIVYDELGPDAARLGPTWSSDTARGWAAMAVGHAPDLDLPARLDLIRPFADDPHFAVREWAWLSVRSHIAASVPEALRLLTPWTTEASERLRRFTSEVTRPRGVWSAHLPALKQNPELGLSLLDPLRHDDARYVQNSVGNWLNDAAKTTPDWVRTVCANWLADSPTSATERICRRASRSLISH